MNTLIQEDRLIDTFLELVSINAPTFQERPVADYLQRQFSRIGLRVEEDRTNPAGRGDCGNLLIRMPGKDSSSPTIMLAAHLDTILPTEGLKVVERDGVFYSGGDTILGADDRAGVAIILEIARVFSERGGSRFPLELLFTVAEEQGLVGSKKLSADWFHSRMAFILDIGGEVVTVINRAPFGEHMKAVLQGKATHSGVEPEAGISAIEMASRAIAKMKLGRIDGETTANIGTIQGGQATNIVPERVEITGEARSLNENSLRKQIGEMEQALRQAAAEFNGRVEIKRERTYPGFHIPKDAPLLELIRTAAEKLRLPFKIIPSGGASDANILNGLGIPAVAFSVGMNNPHTQEENIARRDLVNSARVLLEMLPAAVISSEDGSRKEKVRAGKR